MDMENITINELVKFIYSFGKKDKMSGFTDKYFYHISLKIEDTIDSRRDMFQVEENLKNFVHNNNFKLIGSLVDLEETYSYNNFDEEVLKNFCELKIIFNTRKYDELMGKYSSTNTKSLLGDTIITYPRTVELYIYDQWK